MSTFHFGKLDFLQKWKHFRKKIPSAFVLFPIYSRFSECLPVFLGKLSVYKHVQSRAETKRGNRISPNYLHCPKFTHRLTLGSKISTAQFMPYPSILSLSILTKKTISLFLLLICAYKRCIFFKMGHYHCMMEKSCQATNFYLLCRSLGIVGQVWNIFAGKDPPENFWIFFWEFFFIQGGRVGSCTKCICQ